MNPQRTLLLGGDLPVARLGFGAMRLTGPGNWGYPADRAGTIALLRRAVDLGVTLIDTSDAYGPFVSEELIAEALHPYPDDLVIATKGGVTRQGPNLYADCGRPEYLRQCIEMSLRRLKLERIDLYQLHRIDPQVPLEESIGALARAREEGRIRHIGLSEVTFDQLIRAQAIAPIASVQNLYNLSDRCGWYGDSERLVEHCTGQRIAFLPWAPLDRAVLARPDHPLAAIARRIGATPGQLALAWLLHRSPCIAPIPGTSSILHLEENLAAWDVPMSEALMAELDGCSAAMPSPFAGGAPLQGAGR
jgi:pyridoxine 4-dehydrogenase